MNDKTQLIVSAFAIALLCFIIFCLASSYFDIAPPAVYDVGKWISDNTLTLTFAVCFITFAWLLERIVSKKDGGA
jgi:hypothetical protein